MGIRVNAISGAQTHAQAGREPLAEMWAHAGARSRPPGLCGCLAAKQVRERPGVSAPQSERESGGVNLQVRGGDGLAAAGLVADRASSPAGWHRAAVAMPMSLPHGIGIMLKRNTRRA